MILPDSNRQKLAKSYRHVQVSLVFADWLLLFIYSYIWIKFQIIQNIDKYTNGLASSQLLFTIMLFVAGITVIRLPLIFYWMIIVPQKYGLSVENILLWLFKYLVLAVARLGRNLLLISLFYGAINLILIGKSAIWNILFVVCFGGLFNPNIFSLLTMLFASVRPLSQSNPDIDLKLREFSREIGFLIKKINVYETGYESMDVNAFAYMGKSTVSIGGKLIKMFSIEEIQAIFAHEIGHLKVGMKIKYPRLLSLYLNLVHPALVYTLFVFVISRLALLLSLSTLNVIWLPIIYIIVNFYYVSLALIYSPIRRRMEFAADEFASQAVGVNAYIQALIHLTDTTLIDYSSRRGNFIFSEPTVNERIERLKNLQESN